MTTWMSSLTVYAKFFKFFIRDVQLGTFLFLTYLLRILINGKLSKTELSRRIETMIETEGRKRQVEGGRLRKQIKTSPLRLTTNLSPKCIPETSERRNQTSDTPNQTSHTPEQV